MIFKRKKCDYKKEWLNSFNYSVKDLNEKEIVLCGGYVRNTTMTIKKEWIGWIVYTLRSMLPLEYYDPSSIRMKKNEDCILAVEKIVTQRSLSWLEIYTQNFSEYKRTTPFTLPYLTDNQNATRAYIEPLLSDLAKFAR